MEQAKTKVSITLHSDVIRTVDRAAKKLHTSRSAVIDGWLRQVARKEEEANLRRETIAYYESLSLAARTEDKAIARASGRAARRLRIDE